MAVRNFYVEGNIDGRSSRVTGGPRSKEDGMRVVISQRNNGEIDNVISIDCYVDTEGKLVTNVFVKGVQVAEVITDR